MWRFLFNLLWSEQKFFPSWSAVNRQVVWSWNQQNSLFCLFLRQFLTVYPRLLKCNYSVMINAFCNVIILFAFCRVWNSVPVVSLCPVILPSKASKATQLFCSKEEGWLHRRRKEAYEVMYKVNIHYCYYILITPPLYHCCHSPPIFPNFCHLSSIHSCLLSPFSCSISPSSCSAFPTAGPFFQFLTISSSSCTLSLYTGPSPLFQIWPAPFLPLPAPSLSCLSFFPSSYFPAVFTFPVYLSHLVHFYLLSSFFSYLSSSCPFFYAGHASFSLFLSPLPTSYSHYFIFSVLIPQFPCPSIQFQCVFC